MISDMDILENRLQAVMELPRMVPALTVIEFTAEDLDRLDAAYETSEYWHVLHRIVCRIQGSWGLT